MIEQIHRLSINYLCKKQYEKKTIAHITCLKMTNNSLAWRAHICTCVAWRQIH